MRMQLLGYEAPEGMSNGEKEIKPNHEGLEKCSRRHLLRNCLVNTRILFQVYLESRSRVVTHVCCVLSLKIFVDVVRSIKCTGAWRVALPTKNGG